MENEVKDDKKMNYLVIHLSGVVSALSRSWTIRIYFLVRTIENTSCWPLLNVIIFSPDFESSIDSDLPISGSTVYIEMSIGHFITRKVQETRVAAYNYYQTVLPVWLT